MFSTSQLPVECLLCRVLNCTAYRGLNRHAKRELKTMLRAVPIQKKGVRPRFMPEC